MSQTIRVLVADDHALVREGIRALLEQQSGIEVVGEVGDGRQAVERYGSLAPDVVLMDIAMPEMDGAEATRAILARDPKARVLLLTGGSVDERVLQALEAGAIGYQSKSAHAPEFAGSIRRVHAGEPSLPAEITQKLLDRLQAMRHHAPAGTKLTPRESEILRQVAHGRSNQRIADRMHIAEATVRTHVSHILGKLGLSNRVEATLWALRHGLVDLDEVSNP